MFRLSNFLRHATTKDVVINTGGNYFNFLFAGIYTLLFVRVFTPIEFGVLSVLLVLSYLLANVLSFGMPAAIYAHIPELLPDKKKAIEFAKTNFLLLTCLSFSSLIVLYLFVDVIDKNILKLGAPKHLYALAFLGSAFYIWQNYVRDILNAAQKFLHINIAINVSNILKVIVLVVLFGLGKLTIGATLFVLGILGPSIVFLMVLFERKWIITSLVTTRIDSRNIKVGYTLTYFIATQLFSLATRVDLFMVSYFLSSIEVGYYSLSQRIILAVVTSADSITQVLSPQFAIAKTKKEVIALFKRSFSYMLLPAGMVIVGIFLPEFIYDLVFTHNFSASTPITKLLSFAYIPFGFIAAALLFFLYTIKKPVHLLVVNALLLVIFFIGNYVLIPIYGLFTPPLVALTAFVVVSLYIAVFISLELKKL